jgi:type II secretion system protein N
MGPARWLLLTAAAALACGRSEPEPPERTLHLERWDGAGLPVVGDIDLTMRGLDEESDLTTATGSLELVCDPCVIEGGKIPVPGRHGRANAFGDSLNFPRVDLGMVRGTLEIAGGRGTLEGRAAGGQAVEITVSGTIKFAERVNQSPIDFRFLFRPAPDLQTSSPQLSGLILLLGPADASGAVSFQVTGELGRPKPVSRW